MYIALLINIALYQSPLTAGNVFLSLNRSTYMQTLSLVVISIGGSMLCSLYYLSKV